MGFTNNKIRKRQEEEEEIIKRPLFQQNAWKYIFSTQINFILKISILTIFFFDLTVNNLKNDTVFML